MEKLFLFSAIVIGLAITASSAGYAYAQADVVQNTNALITAIGALMGSVGGIIVAVVGFLSNKKADNETRGKNSETYEGLEKVGLSLIKTDRWILENQERITNIVRVLTEHDPKLRESLEARSLEIRALADDFGDVKKELDETFSTYIPKIDVPRK